MNFVFDNNLSHLFAKSIATLCEHEADIVVIHLSQRFPRDVKDPVWIPALASDAGRWYVVSIDKFKKDQRAEREAIRRAGHTVYVLDPQWASQTFWPKAARLTLWWPHIIAHARLTSGGVFRVPWRHTSQSRFHAM